MLLKPTVKSYNCSDFYSNRTSTSTTEESVQGSGRADGLGCCMDSLLGVDDVIPQPQAAFHPDKQTDISYTRRTNDKRRIVCTGHGNLLISISLFQNFVKDTFKLKPKLCSLRIKKMEGASIISIKVCVVPAEKCRSPLTTGKVYMHDLHCVHS